MLMRQPCGFHFLRPRPIATLRAMLLAILVLLQTLLFPATRHTALGQDASPAVGAPAVETPPGDDPLLTIAERSQFTATATYEQVMELCRALAGSPRVRLESLATSIQGRDIPLLVISRDAGIDAAHVREGDKLPVLLLGNIHAGEVCGKEALLMLARELSRDMHESLLDQLVLLVVPILNPDGNEPFSPDNRPGQNGPLQGVGKRTNGQGLDLNRDHIKLVSPEVRGFVNLLTEWDPAIVIDTHTTNGSFHRYALTYDGPRNAASPDALIAYMRDDFLPAVGQSLREATGYETFYYGDFAGDHGRWESYPAWPRYGTQYVAVRGRLSILSEAYAYASYRDRVMVTRYFVQQCLQRAALQRETIRGLIHENERRWVDADLIDAEPTRLPLRSEPVALDRRFTVLGYDESTVDATAPPGTLPTDTKDYADVDYLGVEQPTLEVVRPAAYLIPAELTPVIENLRQHGLQLQVLREDLDLPVEAYRLDSVEFSERPFQQHHLARVEVTAETTECRVEAGSVLVSTRQPLGRLAMLLLEPASQDGLTTWNFFDPWLKPGERFPVLRLLKPLPLLTADEAQLRSDATPPVPLSEEVLYGGQPPNFSGDPVSGWQWFPDGEHWLHYREGHWRKVVAASGVSQVFASSEKLQRLLSGLPGIDAATATRLVRELRPGEDCTTAIWLHQDDIFLARLDGSLVVRLTDTPQAEELATLSPDAHHVAFVRDYDLYVVDASGRGERRLTHGGHEKLRHGKADWVYFEEIYNRSWSGFRWSPDSRQVAFLEFDDRSVLDFIVLDHMPHQGRVERESYPKAGDPIPQVRLGVVSIEAGDVRWITLDGYSKDNLIVTRYTWLPDSQRLLALVQDRAQRWMDVLIVDTGTGNVTRLLREHTPAWVDDPGDPIFLSDGSFVLRSDRDGWRHLVRFSGDGAWQNAITQGPWEVRDVKRYLPEEDWLYFTATRDDVLEEHLYRVHTDGTGLQRLTPKGSFHRLDVAPRGTLFIDRHNHLTAPEQVVLRAGDGQLVRRLDTNPVPDLNRYARGQTQRVEVPVPDAPALPGILITPRHFDASRRYPVWINTYAGPHAFTVTNEWRGGRSADQLLAEMGILVLQFDPRSASGRGPASTWSAYRQLGVQELKDLEAAADWLAAQPYVDGQRIGIGGYSYGGFMAAYALTHSKKFSAGFSGAPVTDWRNYDAFYTERYMDTPQENPDGYRNSSVVAAAESLHGQLLIVHGAMDDNVHLQNTLQFVRELQKFNKDFEMMIYPTSRHGIHGEHFRRLRLDFVRRTMLSPRD